MSGSRNANGELCSNSITLSFHDCIHGWRPIIMLIAVSKIRGKLCLIMRKDHVRTNKLMKDFPSAIICVWCNCSRVIYGEGQNCFWDWWIYINHSVSQDLEHLLYEVVPYAVRMVYFIAFWWYKIHETRLAIAHKIRQYIRCIHVNGFVHPDSKILCYTLWRKFGFNLFHNW